MRPILSSACVAALAAVLTTAFTAACGHGGVVESRPLATDFDAYRSGAVEVEPAGLEGGTKGSEEFLAYLEHQLKTGGVLQPLAIDQGAQLIVRVRAATNRGDDDVGVIVDFIDGRTRQTVGQITVGENGLVPAGAAMRRVADQIVEYMRSHRRTLPSAKASREALVPAAPATPAAPDAGPPSALASGGTCKTTCAPDVTSALPPEDPIRLAEALQPMLQEMRLCLDRISAQAITPAVILRFESQPGQLTQLKVDAGGYEELACIVTASSRTPHVMVTRASSVRCAYRCAK